VKRSDEDDGAGTPLLLRLKSGAPPAGDQWKTLTENTHARELEKDLDLGRRKRAQVRQAGQRGRERRADNTKKLDAKIRALSAAYRQRHSHPARSTRAMAAALALKLGSTPDAIRGVLRRLNIK